MKKKIYYHDTDCGGVVYYANYLKYMEEARTEFMAERGIIIKELSDKGVMFVIARQEIDYKSPAFYADILDVSSKINKIAGVKIEFEHEVRKGSGQIICIGKAILVCVDKDIKPRLIPEDVKEKLS